MYNSIDPGGADLSRTKFFERMKKEVASAYEWTEELVGISTGSLAIDRILGKVGGFPRRRLTEVLGWESAGKTTLCLQACAAAQRKGFHATYIDIERAVDLEHARLLDFNYTDPEKGGYLTPRTIEETFEIIDGLIVNVKTDLLICDSIAAMVPTSVLESAKWDEVGPMAQRARYLSEALPRIANTASQNNVAVVFVNQMRMKIDTSWPNRGKPKEHSPGGSALKFFASLRLELKQIKKNFTVVKATDPVTGKDIEIPTQSLHNAYAFKNKVSDPYQDADFYIRFDKQNGIYGVDNLQTIIDAAKAQDIIEKKSGGWMHYTGSAPFKIQGEYPVYEHLLQHPELVTEIREALRAKGLF